MRHWLLAAALSGAVAAHAVPPEWVAAKVVKVDTGRSRVTLDHAYIKSIDMAAMVMPFKVDAGVDLKRFKPGDKVRVRTEHIPGHVRAPGYVRGKTGVVVSESPAYPFPDAHAHGIHAEDEPTYDVRFNAEELWPNSADPAQVHVGVFQSYLERVA